MFSAGSPANAIWEENMMRKIWVAVLTAMLLVLCFAGLAAGETGGNHTITSKTCETYIRNTEDKLVEPITLYFLDGTEDLPYVEIREWADVMVGFHRYIYEDDYSLTIYMENSVVTLERESGYTMTLDFENDVIGFDDFNAFESPSNRSVLLDLVSERGVDSDGNPLLMSRLENSCFERYGESLRVDLKEYGIRMLYQDEAYFVPLQTANDLTLMISEGNNLLYNGRELFLAQCDDLYNTDVDSPTLLGGKFYGVSPSFRSQELAEYSYHELCMVLDTFYGLKETHRISTFAELFQEIGYDVPLQSTDPRESDKALMHFIDEFIDDLHSSFDLSSPMCEDRSVPAASGSNSRSYNENLDRWRGVREAQYPDGWLKYEEVGNTAYITFDHFTSQLIGSEYYRLRDENDLPDDTIAQIIEAHAQITREDSPIENVVLDLTCNPGGSLDAAMYVLGWMLGEARFSVRDTSTGAMSTIVYRTDVNLDHEFDSRDTVTGKRLYCLISPCSFSCANLVPAMLKASGVVTLIGRTSGGGGCLVQPMSTAYGTVFTMSSPYQLSTTKNGAYYHVDQGVEPDYYVDRIENIYDRKKLTDYINGLF